MPLPETDTPALVEGIHEPVDAEAAPADAARRHLAAKESRYRIAEPRRDLVPVQTVTRGAEETVRLQQRHRGVPVLGGQYVVRMEHERGRRAVTGTSGKYFTGLTADYAARRLRGHRRAARGGRDPHAARRRAASPSRAGDARRAAARLFGAAPTAWWSSRAAGACSRTT